MILNLIGHDYKYAVEQIMLALFPNERPEYVSGYSMYSEKPNATSELGIGTTYAQATTIICYGGIASRGVARVNCNKLTGKLITDRLLQRIIKQSFYRAALDFLDPPPVWGSLTGIRPAHVATTLLESGISEKSAISRLIKEYYVSPQRAEMCVQAALSSQSLKSTLKSGDIALYVGIPFCPTRCAYCSFVSNSVEKSFGLIEPFVKTLLSEINVTAEAVRDIGARIIAVYIGGGTPTSLPAEALEEVMASMKAAFDFSNLREYTVEAGRPDTVTWQKLDIISRLGAKRVCVNPQSMSNDVLSAIGRKHTSEDVIGAVRLVRQSGMALNMDIIAGLPADTPTGFQQTLDIVLALNPENVTVHTLSLKKGSRIMLEGTVIPSGADVSMMLEYASQRLRGNGFTPYYLYRQKFTSGGFENTGWSLPGHEGIYNICMMEELCTVLALGGGGVTKIVSPSGRIERVFNAKYPREYIMKADEVKDKIELLRSF